MDALAQGKDGALNGCVLRLISGYDDNVVSHPQARLILLHRGRIVRHAAPAAAILWPCCHAAMYGVRCMMHDGRHDVSCMTYKYAV